MFAEGVDVAFESRNAGEAPVVIGDGLDEDGFAGSYGVEFFLVGCAVISVESGVVGGQEDGLACECVADGVVAGDGLARIGSGAGGILSVGAIGG